MAENRPTVYPRHVIETSTAAHAREQRQIDVSDLIDAREVGRGAVARIYRDHPGDEKKFIKACAEWADGELVAAHIAYENDILCTNDCGKNAAGPSIFNCKNRSWLTAKYGVVFKTTDQLLAEILK